MTPSRGVTPEGKKILRANLQRTVEKRGRTKKGRQIFQEKNRGVTPSVAAPGVTHPSDATADFYKMCNVYYVHLSQGQSTIKGNKPCK